MTSGKVNTTAYDKRYIEFAWERTSYSIPNNTTTIKWTLTARGSGNWSKYKAAPFKVTIDGEQIYYSDTRITTKPDMQIASGTYTFTHNTDGTRSFSASVSAAIYYSSYNCSGNGTFTLDAIPRKATISDAPDITDEMESVEITYTNLAGASVESLRVCIDGIANYQALEPTGTTYTFTFNDTEREVMRAKSIANGSAEFTAEWVIETVISGEKYYDRVPKTGTIVNAEPQIDAWGYEETDWYLLTGDMAAFIVGHNQIYIEAHPYTRKDAEITSIMVTNNGVTKNYSEDGDIWYNITDGNFTITVTDNRNLSNSAEINLTPIPYVSVTTNLAANIELLGEETAKITLNIDGNFFNESFGAEDNELTLKYRIKSGNGDYSEWITISNAPTISSNQYKLTYEIPTALDYRNTYTVQVAAYDKIFTDGVNSIEVTLKAIPVFDWSETDFNFNVPISFNKVMMQDFIVEQDTKNGWTYRKWDSGVMECWRRLQITTNVSNAWGSLYTSGALSATNLAYPFEFTETPILTVTLASFGSGGLIMATGNNYGSATNTGAFEIARGNSASSLQFLLNYHAIGRYK